MSRFTLFAMFCICLLGVLVMPAMVFIIGLPPILGVGSTVVFFVVGMRYAARLQ